MKENPINSSRFREAREMSGLSAGQAAKYLNLSLTDLLRIETGELDLGIDQIQKLASLYEVDLDWLSGDASNSNITYLGNLQIAPRELEKIKPEELPKLIQILSAIKNRRNLNEY